MMKLRSVRLSILLLLAAVIVTAACSPAADEKQLFMWQVKSETATVSMVGSIHVGKPDFFPLPEPIEQAFAAASVLAVEVDLSDPEVMQKTGLLMMQKGMLPAGTTLADRLSPELWQRLQDFAAAREINLAMYQSMKPGIVAMILVLQEYQNQGFDPELGIDKHFLDAARTQDKEIRSLETIEAQMDLFFSIDDQLDDLLVDEFLDQMDELVAMIDQMVYLWQSGDVDGLDRFLQDQMGDDPDLVEFYRKMLDDRNVKMADQIDAMLQGDTDVFVVVGAGHFAGKMGILSLLEGKGHEVEQMRR